MSPSILASAPKPEATYSGKYIYTPRPDLFGNSIPTGEIFALRIVPEATVRAKRTHMAKSNSSFWEGTAEDFRANFEKV